MTGNRLGYHWWIDDVSVSLLAVSADVLIGNIRDPSLPENEETKPCFQMVLALQVFHLHTGSICIQNMQISLAQINVNKTIYLRTRGVL